MSSLERLIWVLMGSSDEFREVRFGRRNSRRAFGAENLGLLSQISPQALQMEKMRRNEASGRSNHLRIPWSGI